MNFSLDGKGALVTGGSKGICRSIVLAFAEHGAHVAIVAPGREALEATRCDSTVSISDRTDTRVNAHDYGRGGPP